MLWIASRSTPFAMCHACSRASWDSQNLSSLKSCIPSSNASALSTAFGGVSRSLTLTMLNELSVRSLLRSSSSFSLSANMLNSTALVPTRKWLALSREPRIFRMLAETCSTSLGVYPSLLAILRRYLADAVRPQSMRIPALSEF